MRIHWRPIATAGAVATLAACATVPNGPGVMVLPGTGKPFDQFRVDDANCRNYASAQIGGAGYESAAADSTARSAALGTVVGAVAGAAIGGARGAGVGAGSGLIVGTAAGANAGQVSGAGAQRRYDAAYIQCMYASGHRVPVYGQFTSSPPAAGPAPRYAPAVPFVPAPGVGVPPPPPPGAPPPPPPGAVAR